jgi:hypothetical protein
MSENKRSPIVVFVSPIRNSPGRFWATLASTDELLVCSSRHPFVDAARTLIEKGYDPTLTLEMKYAGSNLVALRARLGKAARLSVEEGVNGPRFVPFRKDLKSCGAATPVPFGALTAAHTSPGVSRFGEPSTQYAVEALSVCQKRKPAHSTTASPSAAATLVDTDDGRVALLGDARFEAGGPIRALIDTLAKNEWGP